MKKALITGITGQDAAYMAQLLLQKGYHVIGVGRTLNEEKLWRLRELSIAGSVELKSGDITDTTFLFDMFRSQEIVECYNFAAISFVGQSWQTPQSVININTHGVVSMLEVIRQVSSMTRLYQAGSSEMFGRPIVALQDESIPFAPCNPYGVTKLSAYHLVKIYREAYGVYGANAICYNHESPLRGIEYVTRKITDGVARIKLGLAKEISLGNIESRRDWGYAGDYVQAMWSMLQQDVSDDYVLATGETHSIREFLDIAFGYVGILDWQQYVVEDKKFFRPLEPHLLCGNNTKASTVLGWQPSKSFFDIVTSMVQRDMERLGS